MNVESESEREARQLFERIGLSPRKVPTTNERTADFTVDGDGPGYLVEVKGRNPPDEMMVQLGPGEAARGPAASRATAGATRCRCPSDCPHAARRVDDDCVYLRRPRSAA